MWSSSSTMMWSALRTGLTLFCLGLRAIEYMGYRVRQLFPERIRPSETSLDGPCSPMPTPSSSSSLNSGISRVRYLRLVRGQWVLLERRVAMKDQFSSLKPVTWLSEESPSSLWGASMRPTSESGTGASPTLPSVLGKQAVIYCSPLGHAYITTRPRQGHIRRGGRIPPAV